MSKVLILLTVIPVAALLIIIVIPILLIAVTIFWCFMYFAKKKYEGNPYYKCVNRKFSFNHKTTAAYDEKPSEAVIDAKYKTLEVKNLK